MNPLMNGIETEAVLFSHSFIASVPITRRVLPDSHEFSACQSKVSGTEGRSIQSRLVISAHQKESRTGEDYRAEKQQNPVSGLCGRRKDNAFPRRKNNMQPSLPLNAGKRSLFRFPAYFIVIRS